MTTETDKIEADLQNSRTRLNDTLSQLGGKLSPGQILDEGLGLFQGQAGEFAGKLGKQVKDNPLPTLLIGAGIAMLFMNNRTGHGDHSKISHDDWRHDTNYRSLEQARWSTQRELNETDEVYEGRLYGAYAKALELRQFADESADAFKTRVSDTVHKAERMAHAAREKIGHGVSNAAHFAQKQGRSLKQGVDQARHGVQDFYSDNPLALGAAAFAIGAALGSVTPLSNAERESLGDLADSAANAGANLAEKGARAVKETLEIVH